MVSADSPPLFGRALLGSLAVHVLVALCIPAMLLSTAGSSPVEIITFARITRLAVVRPVPPQPPPRAAAPHRSLVTKVSLERPREIAKTVSRRKASPPPTARRAIAAAPDYAQANRIGAQTGEATSVVPKATAAPIARTVASAQAHAGGYLPFGAEQPDPVLDPAVMTKLSALGVHVTLVVTVGDDGKTKNVVFQPPIDAQIEAQIQSLLADANWDPAVCGGGVTCQGTATIKL